MTEQWMSIVEYARACNISDMTVRRRIKTGKLHAKLIDNKYYIPMHAESARQHEPAPGHANQQPPMARHPAAQTAPQSGMVVIKNHPSAHRTIQPPVKRVAPEPFVPTLNIDDDDDHGSIPQSLIRPLVAQETTLADTKALLAFCEASLRKANEAERRTVEKFKSKLEALEATLQTRDLEIQSLRQQLEDLQMLVKYLDPKRRT